MKNVYKLRVYGVGGRHVDETAPSLDEAAAMAYGIALGRSWDPCRVIIWRPGGRFGGRNHRTAVDGSWVTLASLKRGFFGEGS